MSDIDNPVALVIEIIAAIVALAALIMMIVNLVQTANARKRGERPEGGEKTTKGSVNRANHMKLAGVLLVAGCIHGIAAMVYDSDAVTATYVFGWTGLAFMLLAGIVVMPPVRKKLGPDAMKAHRALFVVACVFVLAHIIAGRL